jgi:hypothetical protein
VKLEDLTGRTFGNLKVIERDMTQKKTSWICECICGNRISVLAYNLKNGNSQSCGCQQRKKVSERSRKDLSGQIFGQLHVDTLIRTDKNGHSIFSCTCLRCGKKFEAMGTNIVEHRTISCGCARKENTAMALQKVHSEAIELGTNIGKLRAKQALKSNRTTGIRGVCYIKSQGKYKAYITFQKVRYVLKYSTDIEECIKARKEAEAQIFGNFLEWYEEYKKIKPPVEPEAKN